MLQLVFDLQQGKKNVNNSYLSIFLKGGEDNPEELFCEIQESSGYRIYPFKNPLRSLTRFPIFGCCNSLKQSHSLTVLTMLFENIQSPQNEMIQVV